MISQLSDKLKEHGLAEDWVLDRLKIEGENEKSKASERFDVIKFVAILNKMIGVQTEQYSEKVYLKDGVVKELEAKRLSEV